MSPIDPTAEVSRDATIDPSATIWGLAQIREGAHIGAECIIGRGGYVGTGVRIGNRVKVQNFAQIYEPATIGDEAFIGPGVILTNDQYPRSTTPDGALATARDWKAVGVTVLQGASIGARAVCVAPIVIGRWAMVAAGATAVHDVPDFALVAGTPARQIGWVGKSGRRLVDDGDGAWHCPLTGATYRLDGDVMRTLADD